MVGRKNELCPPHFLECTGLHFYEGMYFFFPAPLCNIARTPFSFYVIEPVPMSPPPFTLLPHAFRFPPDCLAVVQMNDYYDVRIKRSNIDMLFDKYGANRVSFFEGDVCNAPFMSRIFENDGIHWVVHMAARAGVRASIEDPWVYVHSNVEATTNLLEMARLHTVKSFVFASSSSVYGESQHEVSKYVYSERRGHTPGLPGTGRLFVNGFIPIHQPCISTR